MKRKLIKFIALTVISALMVLLLPPAPVINAADLTVMSATLTTLKKAVVADQEIMFRTPTGLASGETIILTYDSDFSVATDLNYEDIDLSFEATADGVCEIGDTQMELATSPSSTIMGVERTSSTVITFTNGSTTVAAGGEICIQIGTNATEVVTGIEQITNATTTASFNLVISGTIGEPDTGTIVITTVDDDAVVTTATVLASLSFGMPADVTMGFGTLDVNNERWATADESGSGTETSAHTFTAGTNSTSGYSITINGTTLTSGGDDIDAITGGASNVTTGNGTEQFGIRITAADGSGTVTSPYNGASNNYVLETGSFPDEVASSSGVSATTTYTVYYAANIAADTAAHADYSSTLTYIATGNF